MPRLMMRCFAALFAVLAAGSCLAGGAVTGDDAAEIRAVIHRQIDAFKRDDARAAFALAAPAVQKTFGTPEKFLDVVRASYRAVYRPASVSFLEMQVLDGAVVQQLRVTDRFGRVWAAFYAMQRQQDGSWRTSGCYLAPPVRTVEA